MTDSLLDRAVDGLTAILTANVLGLVVKGATILVLVRYLLSPDEYGFLFFALSIVTFAQLFCDLGFARSAAKYVSEYRESDPAQVPHILRTALAYNLAAIAVVAALLLVFRGGIASLLDTPRLAPLLVIGAGYVAVRSLFVFLKTIFQGFNRVAWSALVTGVASVGEFVFVVGGVVLLGGVTGAFVGYVVAYALAGVVGFAVLYRRFYTRFRRAPAVEAGLPRRIFEYNLPLTLTKGAGLVLSKTDILLVGLFMNTAAVGYYTLGLQIAEFVIIPATSLGFVISPAFGESRARGELDEARTVYETSLKHTLLLYLPAAAGLFVVAEPAVRLVFGASYLNAVPAIRVLTLFVVFKAIDDITHLALDYLGEARLRAVAKGGGAVVNVGLNVLLIPRVGIVGAAVATVCTYAAIVAVNLGLIHRELSLPLGDLARAVARISGVTVGMAVAVGVLVRYVSDVLTLAAVVSFGVGLWALLAVASGLLDRRQLNALLPT
ncbi:MAG: flippase [Haloferacaceae archaeon]